LLIAPAIHKRFTLKKELEGIKLEREEEEVTRKEMKAGRKEEKWRV
jgi:hypothetical protein